MRIAIGSDHRGYAAKQEVLRLLPTLGYDVEDFGCDGHASVDYPDIAFPVALAVAEGRCEAGILIGGHGAGMSITANKLHGVRAGIANDDFAARVIREQQHCNVLCLGVDVTGGHRIVPTIKAFLSTRFASGRHARRVQKIVQIEQRSARAAFEKQQSGLAAVTDDR